MTSDSGRLPQGGDAQQAPCEASQSSAQRIAQTQSNNPPTSPDGTRAFTLRLSPEMSKRLRIEAINRDVSVQQMLVTLIEGRQESESVTVMREALEPFASIGAKLSVKGGWADTDVVELAHGFRTLDKISVAAFHKAREALARFGRS